MDNPRPNTGLIVANACRVWPDIGAFDRDAWGTDILLSRHETFVDDVRMAKEKGQRRMEFMNALGDKNNEVS